MMKTKKESPAQFGDGNKALDAKVKEIITQENIRYYGNIFRNALLKGTFVAAAVLSFVCGLVAEEYIAVGAMCSFICAGYAVLFALVNRGKWVF